MACDWRHTYCCIRQIQIDGPVKYVPVPVPQTKEVEVPFPKFDDTEIPLDKAFKKDIRWREPRTEEQWERYYSHFHQKYRSNQEPSPAVKAARLSNFKQSHREAVAQRAECNCEGYDVDSQLADFAPKEEFAKMSGINKLSDAAASAVFTVSKEIAPGSVEKVLDWTKVWDWGPAKQQLRADTGDSGVCGSSWAFALEQAISASVTMETGYAPELSVQSMIDCGRGSCDGWDMGEIAKFVSASPGFPSREDNMYLAGEGSSCVLDKSKAAAYVTQMTKVPSTIEEVVAALQDGPVMAVASVISWKTYKSGIHQSCPWNPNFLQPVLIVGYRLPSDGNEGYWKVRNSWGEGWGEEGHIRLAMGNTCNILADVWQVKAMPNPKAFIGRAEISCSADACSECTEINTCLSFSKGGPNNSGCVWQQETGMCLTQVAADGEAPVCGNTACFACHDKYSCASFATCEWATTSPSGFCAPVVVNEQGSRLGASDLAADTAADEFNGSVSSCYLLECSL